MIAATDPAQPYGATLPWPKKREGDDRRPSRVAGAHVVLVGADPVLYVERGGKGLPRCRRCRPARRGSDGAGRARPRRRGEAPGPRARGRRARGRLAVGGAADRDRLPLGAAQAHAERVIARIDHVQVAAPAGGERGGARLLRRPARPRRVAQARAPASAWRRVVRGRRAAAARRHRGGLRPRAQGAPRARRAAGGRPQRARRQARGRRPRRSPGTARASTSRTRSATASRCSRRTPSCACARCATTSARGPRASWATAGVTWSSSARRHSDPRAAGPGARRLRRRAIKVSSWPCNGAIVVP